MARIDARAPTRELLAFNTINPEACTPSVDLFATLMRDGCSI